MLSGHEATDSGPKPGAPHKPAKRRVSSAVTSGRRLFVLGNGNSPWSRRYSDLVRLHARDISTGPDLSQAQQSLIRRASAIECELELMEGRLSLGQEVDLDVFTRSSSHLRRILETLGIERRQRDVETLDEHLAKLVAARNANPPPAVEDTPYVDDEAAADTDAAAADDAVQDEPESAA